MDYQLELCNLCMTNGNETFQIFSDTGIRLEANKIIMKYFFPQVWCGRVVVLFVFVLHYFYLLSFLFTD